MKALRTLFAIGFALFLCTGSEPLFAQDATHKSSQIVIRDTIIILDKTYLRDSTKSYFTLPGPLPIELPYKSRPKSESAQKGPKRWRWDAGHWQGIGLNYNGLIQNLGNMHLPSEASWMTQNGKSIGVDIHLIDVTLVSSGCFGLITGLGIECNNFRFDKNVGVTNDENGHIVPDYRYRDSGVELSKSKITTSYINVPLLAEFQFGYKRRGWVNFGIVGGILIDGHAKVKSSEYGIQKKYSEMNLNRFHYGFEIGLGYSVFGIRARYYPQSIFRPGEGPNVQQANIGLTVAF